MMCLDSIGKYMLFYLLLRFIGELEDIGIEVR